jgi:oligopeptide transport system ATP-binding protein
VLVQNLPELDTIMEVRDLKMHFSITKGLMKRQVGTVKAVDGVSFSIKRGKTLGIVGESGSGKSTLGNCLMRNYDITSGDIIFEQKNYKDIPKDGVRRLHRNVQMITQDPFSSLDPRMRIYDIVTEGLIIQKMEKTKAERYEMAERMLPMVGINPAFAKRFPHEFSGGQRQRISIARALAMQPSFIICDEVVSALDVSIQAQIVTLLKHLREELNLTYIFIGHDLSVVRHISDRVAVMYLGKIVELTNSEELYAHPLHPYTQALISAAPIPDPELEETRHRIVLKGEVPSPIHPPKGCHFCTRCQYATEKCFEEEPPFVDVGGEHFVACHLHP